MQKRKLILMGTNDFVVPVFDALATKHDILAVYTRAPKPQGRKQILTKSPVHVWAESKGLPVYTSIKEFTNPGAEYIVVISYGVILGENVLSSAKCINIHPSSLPRYRGPSPIRSAILNGDDNMDVCLMEMTQEMDAGDILIRKNIKIDINDTNADVEHKVSVVAVDMLNEYFDAPDRYIPIAQMGTPTFTHKFSNSDSIIDWELKPVQIHNLVRALGGGRTTINSIGVKILETRISDNKLEILRIQPDGKKPMDWESFVNGLRGADIIMGK
ncbi:MAG: methionyl-tRNA formyltransferase [Proteobacteria bacterium]|nr:methionyl-tRNA formyltransferase [Candidatus Enterousia scatequi]